MSARATALSALIATRRQNAWSDGVLKQYIVRDGLDRRDAAFCTELCYGVLQNRMLLDFHISKFLNGKLKDLQPVVLDILRLGMYQIVFLDRVPASAAVNEAVEQCKRFANRRAAGLVNGVLRAAARAAALPVPDEISVKYSHPQALVALLRESVGDALLEPLLAADNAPAPTTLQINPLKDGEGAVRELTDAGAVLTARSEPAALLDGKLPGALRHRQSGTAGGVSKRTRVCTGCGGPPCGDGLRRAAGYARAGRVCGAGRQELCRGDADGQQGRDCLL